MPPNVELVDGNATDGVLGRDDSFVGVALQEELAATKAALGVNIEAGDFGRWITHGHDTCAVRARREGGRQGRDVNASRYTGNDLQNREVESLAFGRKAYYREVKRRIAIPRNYERIEPIANVARLAAVQDVEGGDQVPVGYDAESATSEDGLKLSRPNLPLLTVSGRVMRMRRIAATLSRTAAMAVVRSAISGPF